jgi:adenylate cyclase
LIPNGRKYCEFLLEFKFPSAGSEAHVAAAQGFSMQQRYADATAEFGRAIELDPTLFDAHYYFARSCFKSGDLEKSLRLFQQAQSVRPDDYQAIYLEALVLTQLGRGDEAREAYQRALDFTTKYLNLEPDDARSHVLGAGALARLQQSEHAKEWADRAISLAPDDDAILYNAACAFAVIGDQERALDALERAIDAGLEGGDWIPQDPDWERLRDLPRFRALFRRLTR